MKRGIVLILFGLCTTFARGGLPTAGYVADYYYQNCGNIDLDVPGVGRTELTSQKYLLEIVDILNENATTYAPDATTNYVISDGYLIDSLDMLRDSNICCVGGYLNIPTDTCESCGEWLVDSTDMCLRAGEYYNNGTCSPCGDGYICDADTSSRVECGPGYYCVGNVRARCTHGAKQCPGRTHTAPPTDVGCDNTWVFTE